MGIRTKQNKSNRSCGRTLAFSKTRYAKIYMFRTTPGSTVPPRADAIDQIDKDVANARYERENPGEIERMGYRTTRDYFDG